MTDHALSLTLGAILAALLAIILLSCSVPASYHCHEETCHTHGR